MLKGSRYNVSDILRVAWRRKWAIVIPTLMIGAAAAVVAARLPDRYRAQIDILEIAQGVPESYVKSAVAGRPDDRLRAMSQQILSRTRLERIVEEFRLYSFGQPNAGMEELVEHLRRDLTVTVNRGESLRISYVGENAERVTRVTERLASLFIEENLSDRQRIASGTNEFLESQLTDARQRLIDQEKHVEAYRRAHEGELPSQLNSNLQLLQSCDLQLQALTARLARERERAAVLEGSIAELDRPDMADAGIAVMAPAAPSGSATPDPIVAARTNLAVLKTRFTSSHPAVIAATRELDELLALSQGRDAGTDVLDAAARSADTPVQRRRQELRRDLAQLGVETRGLEIEEARLRTLVASYRARVEAVPMRETELAQLTRDYDTLQLTYRALLTKKEDSQVATNLERQHIGEHFKILEMPKVPEHPFGPNRRLIDAAGLLVGLCLGAGLAFVLEYCDSTFKTEAEVISSLQLPVFAVVPLMPSKREGRLRGSTLRV